LGYGCSGVQRSLAKGGHDVNTAQRRARGPNGLQWASLAFDRARVLLPQGIKICGVPDDNGRLGNRGVVRNRGRMRAPLIEGDFFWEPLGPNRLASEGLGGGAIAMGGEEKVQGLARCVHGAIEGGPLPFDSHLGFVEPPASAHWVLPAAQGFLNLRGLPAHPAVERGMINRYTALLPHFFQLSVARGGHVPGQDKRKTVRCRLSHDSTEAGGREGKGRGGRWGTHWS
jgi:hypothetical protein